MYKRHATRHLSDAEPVVGGLDTDCHRLTRIRTIAFDNGHMRYVELLELGRETAQLELGLGRECYGNGATGHTIAGLSSSMNNLGDHQPNGEIAPDYNVMNERLCGTNAVAVVA